MHLNDLKQASFYHVMKTGGTSFHMTISQMKDLLGRFPEEHEKWYIVMGMHGSFTELHNRFPDIYEKIKKYYKFCFVRNPFSHAVSLYFHSINTLRWDRELHRTIDKKRADIDDFRDFNNYLENIYVPQSYVTLDDPYFMNDEFFKFENLNESFQILLKKFDYLPVDIMTTNQTKTNTCCKCGKEGNIFNLEYPSDYKTMYDQKGIDIISKRCKNELDKFNYTFY